MLWRTGLMPAAGHGAGVSGITDPSLKALRTLAGSLVGARRSGSLTAWLATQVDPFYDPVFDATVPLMQRCAGMIWDARLSLGRLQRAWLRI
eukprot:6222631-Pyramimonas_sp.AAC.1